MSKAEDKYLEYFQDGRLRNCSSKEAFLLGYHQAEKDNELTWEDVEKIDGITIRLDSSLELRGMSMSNQEFYQEVLKRFNKERE